MTDFDLIKRDHGGVNARIIAREKSKADFRRVEAASLKFKASFASAEGKRMFVRYFNTFQLNNHFISVITRTRLNQDDVTKVEQLIRQQMENVTDDLNKAIDGAEALFTSHGITNAATYDTVPLELEIGVLSSSSRRYLDLLTKLDQLMPLLQTLEIHEVITPQAVDIERAAIKRKVRGVANGARNLALRLRREMNALEAQPAEKPACADSGQGSAEPAVLPATAMDASAQPPASDDAGVMEPAAENSAAAQPD
jgi:hypothetical protein